MLLWGKHKTRDNTNEIEMRDNNNFHRIIFQVFEHCLSALYSHFDFFIVIWHTHRHNIFTPHAVRIHHNFYQHQKCCSALFILFLTVFFFFVVFSSSSPPQYFLFQSNQRSVTIAECGFDVHWYWCFRFGKPSYTIILTANAVFGITSYFLLRIRLYPSLHIAVERSFVIILSLPSVWCSIDTYIIFMRLSLTYNIYNRVWPYLTHMTSTNR